MVLDANFKFIDSLKAKLETVNIGLNKEEKKLIIDSLDNSTNYHFHSEIGLPPETILNLSSKEVGDYVKFQTLLNLKAAHKDNPDKLEELYAKHNPIAFATGATILTASPSVSSKHILKQLSETIKPENLEPMPSGDFISNIEPTIDTEIKFIKAGPQKIKVEVQKPTINIENNS